MIKNKMPLFSLLAASLSLAAHSAFATCYSVFDKKHELVYQNTIAPVDMSLPLHETLPKRFPNTHMVIDVEPTNCFIVTPPPTPEVAPKKKVKKKPVKKARRARSTAPAKTTVLPPVPAAPAPSAPAPSAPASNPPANAPKPTNAPPNDPKGAPRPGTVLNMAPPAPNGGAMPPQK